MYCYVRRGIQLDGERSECIRITAYSGKPTLFLLVSYKTVAIPYGSCRRGDEWYRPVWRRTGRIYLQLDSYAQASNVKQKYFLLQIRVFPFEFDN